MSDNYLITGYWGEPHVTAENDRGINAGIFGKGKLVLPVGEQFRAEFMGQGVVRMYDGKLIDNGAAAGIPAGRYIDLQISEAGQGMKRNDLIVFQYTKDSATLVERGYFAVLKGAETAATATDPTFSESDLLSDNATRDIMALWRVRVEGSVISAPEQLFEVYNPTQYSQHGIITTGTGAAYEAKVEGLKELKAGESFIMVPHVGSTIETPTLNVNGLGAKPIRRRITGNSALTTPSKEVGWLSQGRPVTVTCVPYINNLCWVIDAQPNANDLYGSVPIKNGGTGADNAEEGLRNLGGISKKLLWENDDPSAAYPGKIIGCSLDGYDGFEVLYISDYLDLVVKTTGYLPYYPGVKFAMDCVTVVSSGTTPCIQKRTGYVQTYSPYVEAGQQCAWGQTTMAENNFACIPYRVYGYKNIS